MLRMPLEWLEFGFECFESLSNNSSLHLNASNPLLSNASNLLRIVRICIRMLRMSFEWVEFAFECFEPLSNLHLNPSNPFRTFRIYNSNGSNPFRMVRVCIRMLRIPFEWFEFAFEGSNLRSNASNPFQMVWIWILMLRIPLEGLNLHSNGSNPFRVVIICIRMLQMPSEWFEFVFECFESLSNGSIMR